MRHLKWLCPLCVVALVLLPQLVSAQGDEAPFKPTGEVSIGYWPADGAFGSVWVIGPGQTGRLQADTDARPWMARGEYRFAPRWSAEALLATGDIRTGPWSFERPGTSESGLANGDLGMWAVNVYYSVWRSPQPRYGKASTLDVGVGYQHFREKVVMDRLLPPETAGVVETNHFTAKGLQLGVRGRVPLAKQFDLKAGAFWQPDEDLRLGYIRDQDQATAYSESGDGDGWGANLAAVYAPAPAWEVELGYRYLRHTGSVPAVDMSEVKATQKGFYLAGSYLFK